MTWTVVPSVQFQKTIECECIYLTWAGKEGLYCFGGSYETKHVDAIWYSPEGISWRAVSPLTATFMPRNFVAVVEFKNRVVITGGLVSYGDFYNDVWLSESESITRWTGYTGAFPGRYAHSCFVLNGKVWLWGGYISVSAYYDPNFWNSDDGMNWTVVPPPADPSKLPLPRAHTHFVVYQSCAWLVGGRPNGYSVYNVWRSCDGVSWDCILPNGGASFSARGYHGTVVFGGRLVIFAGSDPSQVRRSDVWTSADGVTWMALAPLPAGRAEFGFAFNGHLGTKCGCLGAPAAWVSLLPTQSSLALV